MHEMALAEGVMQIVTDHAARAGAGKVTCVRLEIGRLSHVEPEALAFCFEAVVRGSVAQGARLEIERVAGRAWCHGCGREVEVQSLLDACPHCGGIQLSVTGGQEMRIRDMEVT